MFPRWLTPVIEANQGAAADTEKDYYEEEAVEEAADEVEEVVEE